MLASIIAPVYNEEENISKLIISLVNQTLTPNEIIFIDGGSKDKTQEIIQKYAKKYKFIKLVLQKNSDKKGKIALARNQGIKAAKSEVIVCADAGCILSKDWLEKMVFPFQQGYDVVYGNYQPLISKEFDKYQSIISVNSIVDASGEIILTRASSRAIAFKKSCWKSVGGYPEDTYTGEDTKYNISLKNKGYKLCFAKDAVSYWNMRPNINSFFVQYKKYGFGDVKSKNIFSLKKNLFSFIIVFIYLLFIIYSFFSNFLYGFYLLIVPLILFFVYGSFLLFSRTKNKENIFYYVKGIFVTSYLLLLKRIGYFFGLIEGLVKK